MVRSRSATSNTPPTTALGRPLSTRPLGYVSKREAPVHRNTRYFDDEVLDRVRELVAQHGDHLTLNAFCRATGMGATTIQSRYGGWLALRALAGLEVRKSALVRGRVHSADELVAKLHAAANQFGPHIKLMQFCGFAGVSSTTIERYCGGWRQLRTLAGLKSTARRRKDLSELDLLFELHRVAVKLRRFPTVQELDRQGRFAYVTYHARFQSLDALRRRYEGFVRRLAEAFAAEGK
jgi:hypothetical protein